MLWPCPYNRQRRKNWEKNLKVYVRVGEMDAVVMITPATICHVFTKCQMICWAAQHIDRTCPHSTKLGVIFLSDRPDHRQFIICSKL
jgi:hypothetical protein